MTSEDFIEDLRRNGVKLIKMMVLLPRYRRTS